MVGRIKRNQNPHMMLVRMQNGVVTLANSFKKCSKF